MRKIETIKKDIERAHAAIEKAEASIPGLQTRMDNAIARAKKAGWDYKGDGNDSHDAPWGAAYQACSTADQAREGIANRKATIAGRKMDLECLERELAEAEAKRAAKCRNSLRWDYSAKDAIEDLDLAIKAAEASRNREEPRRGRRAWDISRKW